jgi:ABC-type glycerol-3-phosphate transport system substrate-binding protein
MANLWGSRADAFVNGRSRSTPAARATRFVPAPTVGGGTTPATTLWWDAFAIAKNIDDNDAVASFKTMLHAISPAVAHAHPDAAVWLASDSNTSAAAKGILETVRRGAKSYPMAPYMGYLHEALGANLAAFMQGRKSAQETLQDIVKTYSTAAREAGYLR